MLQLKQINKVEKEEKMKKSTRLITKIFGLSLLLACFWGNHVNAEEWKDENILRQETIFGMDENGKIFEVEDESGKVSDVVNCEHDAIGNMAIAFVGTSGVQMGWLASQSDMLAEDWVFA